MIEAKGVTHVLLAIPSASRHQRNNVLRSLQQYHVAVRTVPSMADLTTGRINVLDLNELDVEDLLEREPIMPNHILLSKNSTDKVVLITGAGGSIGSELCRQIIRLKPAKLLLVDISEYALYSIQTELEEREATTDSQDRLCIVPLLASVQDEVRMFEIMDTWKPDIVYHAAAYKHVPMVESNFTEGVKNNVMGTLITAQSAIKTSVSDFVLISTDKAVFPTSVMGASKRLAELCLLALSSHQSNSRKTQFSIVRFGNVLDSSGSVIPKFRKQIRAGGPVTLTHPDVTRYFMTIPEAAQLVIQAGAMAKGGDVFILDMGEQVKIAHLARRIIELSGFTIRDGDHPDGDIEITIIGLRQGEKLHEELLLDVELQPTLHPKIQYAQETSIPWSQLETYLTTLRKALDHNDVGVISNLLSKLVENYHPNKKMVDLIQKQNPTR